MLVPRARRRPGPHSVSISALIPGERGFKSNQQRVKNKDTLRWLHTLSNLIRDVRAEVGLCPLEKAKKPALGSLSCDLAPWAKRCVVGMPVSNPASSTLVPKGPLPIHELSAQIDGRTEMWLPPNKLPPGGAFVHVSECPDRLANMSSLLDINNLCATPAWPDKDPIHEAQMALRATSFVRPERSGLFFSKEGRNREVLAFVMPDATVVAGWPHDAWGISTANQTTCPEAETPGEYARRRLDHFVRLCGHPSQDTNRWWAGNFTCFYKERAAIEERQYAYMDLFKQNGTMCHPGQLHNQIMVRWEPDKITRILHTGTAFAAAQRLKNLMPVRQIWQYDVGVFPLLDRCDKCCQEPDCPNPLLTAARDRSRRSVASPGRKNAKQKQRARRQQLRKKQKLRKQKRQAAQKRIPPLKRLQQKRRAPKQRTHARKPRASRLATRRAARQSARRADEADERSARRRQQAMTTTTTTTTLSGSHA